MRISAVKRDEWPFASRAHLMDAPRDTFFARSGFTDDQHRTAGGIGRGFTHLVLDALHAFALSLHLKRVSTGGLHVLEVGTYQPELFRQPDTEDSVLTEAFEKVQIFVFEGARLLMTFQIEHSAHASAHDQRNAQNGRCFITAEWLEFRIDVLE